MKSASCRSADRARPRDHRGPIRTAWARVPRRRVVALASTVLLLLGAARIAWAEGPRTDEPGRSAPFEADGLELELGLSPFFSLQDTSDRRPQIDDVGAHLRFGWMLSSPSTEGFWRGNLELLVAAQGAAVVVGPGNLLAGGSLIVRRNFVQPGARFVPYAQLEAGALHNDVHDDPDQRVVGQSFEFQLGGGIGSRILIGESWAVHGEIDYRHVSNGGLATRNLGLNSVGALIGVARFF